jgi:predicted RNA methylase
LKALHSLFWICAVANFNGVASLNEVDPPNFLWHRFGTDIEVVSTFVHVRDLVVTIKNQQLTFYVILGWKQAGLDIVT